jgi:hypothetical protein
MNIRAYTLTGAIIVAGCLAGSRQLHAQTTFTIPFTAAQSSPAASFKIDSFGTLSATAPTSTSATFSFTGTPQMVWMPALGAFRAGTFSGNQTTVGQNSVALGGRTATNIGSMGLGGYATGIEAFATTGAPPADMHPSHWVIALWRPAETRSRLVSAVPRAP